jgi:tetratricopeptide (TPR) repeat protein
MQFSNKSILSLLLISYILCSCNKETKYLELVPNQSLSIPNSLNTLQLMLQNETVFNQGDLELGEFASDDCDISTTYSSSSVYGKNVFTWAANPYPNQDVPDWDRAWVQINNANTVLDNLNTYISESSTNSAQYNFVKGSALFFRARAFFDLMTIFTAPYDSTKEAYLVGLPITTSSLLVPPTNRSSEKDCYNQILSDLTTAASILPTTASLPTMASKDAVYGLLSRIYLSQSKYPQALYFAGAALQIDSAITDYNGLTLNIAYTLTDPTQFPLAEDIFHGELANYYDLSPTVDVVDSSLYASYDSLDIRKQAFFQIGRHGIFFKGSYNLRNVFVFYDGVSNDELLLTSAECKIRSSNVDAGLQDLNSLLSRRYVTGQFAPYSNLDQATALNLVLNERRKELLFRGLRWQDLRRLNLVPAYAKTLHRNINGVIYSLPPNDLRYAFLLPDEEVKPKGNLTQNPR